MTGPIVERVLASPRYRHVDRGLVERLAAEELARLSPGDDAVKRVKRRLHQAVGAFAAERRAADPLAAIRDAWRGDLRDHGVRAACADALRRHASTAERIPFLDRFHAGIWAVTGVPRRVLDIGCGLHPLSLPWMGLVEAEYVATDVDRAALATVDDFLELVGQPHAVHAADAVAAEPMPHADVALLFKLVPTLDRQKPAAAASVLRSLRAAYAVVSFPRRSLGGRGRGMERTYRMRLERLVDEVGRVREVAEASVPNELVFVLTLDG